MLWNHGHFRDLCRGLGGQHHDDDLMALVYRKRSSYCVIANWGAIRDDTIFFDDALSGIYEHPSNGGHQTTKWLYCLRYERGQRASSPPQM